MTRRTLPSLRTLGLGLFIGLAHTLVPGCIFIDDEFTETGGQETDSGDDDDDDDEETGETGETGEPGETGETEGGGSCEEQLAQCEALELSEEQCAAEFPECFEEPPPPECADEMALCMELELTKEECEAEFPDCF